jgi:CBS domain containing-hemolysin-like protein
MMPSTRLTELIPVLQIAIAPVILISGVGLLLLSLTNRFGRAVDRTREIHHEMRKAAAADRPRLAYQVEVIYRRARLIQFSIVMGALSALFAAILILALFLAALMKWESSVVISLIFICCLVSLVVSLITFIMDIRLSLKALKLELTRQPEA